jgi:hypothetical protein
VLIISVLSPLIWSAYDPEYVGLETTLAPEEPRSNVYSAMSPSAKSSMTVVLPLDPLVE